MPAAVVPRNRRLSAKCRLKPFHNQEASMANILVLYYSSYGQVEIMAGPIPAGGREVASSMVTIKRVSELVPEEVARNSGFKLDQKAPIATVEERPSYHAIIFG